MSRLHASDDEPGAAGRDGARSDDDDLDAIGVQAGNLVHQRLDVVEVELLAAAGQQVGAESWR